MLKYIYQHLMFFRKGFSRKFTMKKLPGTPGELEF